jgi:hypothetical protein
MPVNHNNAATIKRSYSEKGNIPEINEKRVAITG